MKRIVTLFLSLLFVLLALFPAVLAQEMKIEAKSVVYTLPYPGILPDNPIYPLKVARDRILEFFTRDYAKKAQLYLLFSDKRLRMGQELAEKGKWKIATATLSKAEIYTAQIIPLYISSKKQGAAFTQEFVDQTKQSNAKHQEIIESLIQDAPQEQQINLQNALKINHQNSLKLSSL